MHIFYKNDMRQKSSRNSPAHERKNFSISAETGEQPPPPALLTQEMLRKTIHYFFQFFTPISKQRWLSSSLLQFFQGTLSADSLLVSSFAPIDFPLFALFAVIWGQSWDLLKNLYHSIVFVLFWFMSSSICIVGSVSSMVFLFFCSFWVKGIF